MILVTGTKRSGTSMWMQVLIAAGMPHIGDAFPGPWQESIGAANPRGFFESELRNGIYFASNPHPATGVFLQPERTRSHVVKVFIPGLVRTDYAFLDHVVATMRHPAEYCASIQRLRTMEQGWLSTRDDLPDAKTPALLSGVEWWMETYDLLRDVAVRRYPLHMTAYGRLLEDPERVLRQVFAWLGQGEMAPALAAIDAELRTQQRDEGALTGLEADEAALALELHACVFDERPVPASLLTRINQAHQGLLERVRSGGSTAAPTR